MLEMILDSFLDALIDGAKLFPFLFVAFLFIEGIEHRSKGWLINFAEKSRKLGPLWGSALGLIPQCGFSVMTANMYAGGLVTLGTLLAVFLSTSDEAIIIMLGNPSAIGKILPLLACKLLIGIVAGFVIDAIFCHHDHEHKHEPHDLCENCGCDKYPGIVHPSLYHSCKLFIFILLISFVINVIIGLVGMETLSAFLLKGSIFQPLLTALIGLIPNCAASVLITQLYIEGGLTFGSTIAGLCAGAGVGLAILFRMHKCTSKNIGIVALLFGISAASGIVINIIAGLL